ncbi:hypothetical protein DLJ53_05840 [Acuticoccus sediminis]|uniref:Modulator of FtsH protease n=1 Tax=Acuticoccus sediminis TaxID=2184697 RepID=A0A8B2P203_9HYPH|nr:Bax inhibitor-1/YccA family protein [Acuticoccus sediminis]RAI03984.1 hypothetical protein DLJ53_05840 [Acuticoccus sediminis]
MATWNRNTTVRPTTGAVQYDASIDQGLRSYMLQVYNYMAIGLALTGVAALGVFALATTQDAAGAAAQIGNGIYLTQFGVTLFTTPLKWVLALAPLGIVFWLSFGVHKMDPAKARGLFFLYAALVGASLSTIFLVYTSESIVRVFFITAVSFGGLSLYGYTTKKDLSGMGSFLIMGVIGIFIAMLVNIFLQSSALQFAISIIGVLVFAGLTAYDTQRIKESYYVGDDGAVAGRKAVIGALQLYLDFIMMFQFLLSLLGNRN